MISEKFFNDVEADKVFSSDFEIITPNHCNVFVKVYDWTTHVVSWELVNVGEYDIINNAVVFHGSLTLITFSGGEWTGDLKVVVATTIEDLDINPSDCSILAEMQAEIQVLATIADDIKELGLVETGVFQTVADNIGDINTIANFEFSYTGIWETIFNNLTNGAIQGVFESIDNVNIVADNIGSVNLVGSNIGVVIDVGLNLGNITTVVGMEANINTLIPHIANIGVVSTNIDNVNLVGNDIDNINTIAESLVVYTGGTNVTIVDGVISSVDTNTTYTDAEIKTKYENNTDTNSFTDIEKTKLSGVDDSANNYVHPANHTIAEVTGLQTALDGKTTEAYVTTQITNLIDASPDALNTLNELAGALNDDANFAGTMTTALAGKVDDSQVLTNVPLGAVFTDTTYSVGDGGLSEVSFTSTDNTKLDGIESGATGDLTGAEIKVLYESEDNTNVLSDFNLAKLVAIEQNATGDLTEQEHYNMLWNISVTPATYDFNIFKDADQTKLAGIEANATGDMTDAEVKTAYENNAETNVFTDAQVTKLAGIEALAGVTDTTSVTSAGALMDSEVTNLADVKAFDTTDYATSAQGTKADGALLRAGGLVSGDIAFVDNVPASFGNNSNLVIKYDTTNAIIKEQTSSDGLLIQSKLLKLTDNIDDKTYATFTRDGSVDLYYSNSKKFETTASGTTTTGDIVATGDLRVGGTTYHPDDVISTFGDSGELDIYQSTSGYSMVRSNTLAYIQSPDLYLTNLLGAEKYARFVEGGGASLYHSNTKKLETTATGAKVTGDLEVTGELLGDNIPKYEKGTLTNVTTSGAEWRNIAWIDPDASTSGNGERGTAKFQIVNRDSGNHQQVVFYASHNYGRNESNVITVLTDSSYGTLDGGFNKIRIVESSTYDGAVLQVYFNTAETISYCQVSMTENEMTTGWQLLDWTTEANIPISGLTEPALGPAVDLAVVAGFNTNQDMYSKGSEVITMAKLTELGLI
ncbi:tail fiber protein [Podophage Lau218]|uniref:Phage fiber protein n=1 Tax=Podophage Lau218 TaxID=2784187 RepID=A0A060BGW9_9CAUD|nr:tail fiber protein [Podophage Lau218]AIA83155.1 phage fiber protein [Podophage Lau218]